MSLESGAFLTRATGGIPSQPGSLHLHPHLPPWGTWRPMGGAQAWWEGLTSPATWLEGRVAEAQTQGLSAPTGPAWSALSICPQLQDLFSSSPTGHSLPPALYPQLPEAPSSLSTTKVFCSFPPQGDCACVQWVLSWAPSWAGSL